MVKSHKLLESNSQSRRTLRLNTCLSRTVEYFTQENSAYLSICILAAGPARVADLSYQECDRCR
ncbi:hypothetical protein ABIB75_007197 [Bradyrhizobium sp. GM2.2]